MRIFSIVLLVTGLGMLLWAAVAHHRRRAAATEAFIWLVLAGIIGLSRDLLAPVGFLVVGLLLVQLACLGVGFWRLMRQVRRPISRRE